MLKTSIVVPSLAEPWLKLLLWSLSTQSVRPWEVVIVVKPKDDKSLKRVESLCSLYALNCVVVKQREGFFTKAMNIGKREARGDIIIFTDEDAVALPKWVERYIKLHYEYRSAAGISSRDIYLDPETLTILPTPDDNPAVRLYRVLVRPWLERPHPINTRYRLGVYLTRSYSIAHGPYIPSKTCFSLPFRGVNMSFKSELVRDIWFPEHPGLRRALGTEQYFGLQLILKGLDTIYVPSNPILHIQRESLSRTGGSKEMDREIKIMRNLYKELIDRFGK